MTNQQIFDEIEHGDVLYDLLNSDQIATLQARMEKNKTLNIAVVRYDNDEEFRFECLRRAQAITDSEEFPGYLHPSRTAVAAYMYIMYTCGNREGLEFIRYVSDINRPDLGCVTELSVAYGWHVMALDMLDAVHMRPQPVVDICDEIPLPCSFDSDTKNPGTNFVTSRSYSIAV